MRGTRPTLRSGQLGIIVLDAPGTGRTLREGPGAPPRPRGACPGAPVPAGIDGEAVDLEARPCSSRSTCRRCASGSPRVIRACRRPDFCRRSSAQLPPAERKAPLTGPFSVARRLPRIDPPRPRSRRSTQEPHPRAAFAHGIVGAGAVPSWRAPSRPRSPASYVRPGEGSSRAPGVMLVAERVEPLCALVIELAALSPNRLAARRRRRP